MKSENLQKTIELIATQSGRFWIPSGNKNDTYGYFQLAIVLIQGWDSRWWDPGRVWILGKIFGSKHYLQTLSTGICYDHFPDSSGSISQYIF